MTTTTHGYVAICRTCGKAVGATVDDGEHMDDIAATVHEWLRDGLIIERIEIEQARAILGDGWCTCEMTP